MRKGTQFSTCVQQPQALVQAGNPLAEQQRCWKGCGGDSVHQAEHEPAALAIYK